MTREAYLRQQSEYLRKMRKELGLTQKDVADAIGVSSQSVSEWELMNCVMSGHSITLVKLLFKRVRKQREIEQRGAEPAEARP